MQYINHIHGGNLRDAAEKFNINQDDILDFSANINPLGPSNKVLEAIMSNLHQIQHYPDPDCKKLKEKIAQKFNINSDNIVMGNGAVELIYLLIKLLKPRKVLIPAPSFSEYELAVITGGGEVIDLKLDPSQGFKINTDEIINSMKDVDIVIICNPNNPTGSLTEKKELLRIIDYSEKINIPVMVDEAFVDFLPDRDNYSVVDEITKRRNLLVLYSMTKFFAIPGLRLGALLAPNHIVKGMTAIKDPWNVNCFAQVAGEAALEDKVYQKLTIDYIRTEKEYLFKELSQIPGLKPFHPTVNYVFIDISGTGLSSGELRTKMGEKGILIRDCASYKYLNNNFIRVAVRKREENMLLIKKLREVVI